MAPVTSDVTLLEALALAVTGAVAAAAGGAVVVVAVAVAVCVVVVSGPFIPSLSDLISDNT